MAGMIVTWLQNTEKFVSPSAAARSIVIAVDGAVVSNPMAMNTTCRSGFCRAIFSESSGEYTMRISVPAAFASKNDPLRPGHPHHVAERGHDHVRVRRQVHRVVDAPHRDHAHRAAGAVHQGDGLRQVVLEAVLVDRVGVPAAHLHELVGAARLAERRYLRGERVSLVRVPEFVDEPHRRTRPLRRAIRSVSHAVPRSRPRRPGRCPRGTAMAAAASASSILDRAKPTWISTHSPGFGGSSDSRPMLISRLTPLTFTFARSGWSGWISTTSPGIPRHM